MVAFLNFWCSNCCNRIGRAVRKCTQHYHSAAEVSNWVLRDLSFEIRSLKDCEIHFTLSKVKSAGHIMGQLVDHLVSPLLDIFCGTLLVKIV